MQRSHYVFTSESVTEGHPDKICDGVSDAILDACLAQDPHSRVACETLAKTGMVVIAGEITTRAVVNFADIVREKVRAIGYDNPSIGFDGNTCAVLVALDRQSPDIRRGVDAHKVPRRFYMRIIYAARSRARAAPLSCRSCAPTASRKYRWPMKTENRRASKRSWFPRSMRRRSLTGGSARR
jgi:hypothetical protein